MRVLLDYRPALRQRSGVGEYTHQLVKALLAAFPADAPGAPLELTLFSSSWKDRLVLPEGELPGAATIDRHVPVSVLNRAWHRFGWPPAELLTGRRFDVTHSLHPLILPSRAAAHVVTIHDLDFLAHPERTRAEIRRDYPALARDHAHRADRVIVPSRFTAGEVERLLGVPADRISVCPPGAPDWAPREALPPATATCCSSARWNRARTSADCSTPMSDWRSPADGASARPRRSGVGRGAAVARADRARAARTAVGDTSATSTRRQAARAV